MTSINFLPLESISGFIWLNGHFVEWQNAKIHVLTHSLHYSGGVFEGEKAFNGKIFKIKEHTERLFASAKKMHLDISYSSEEIIAASIKLLEMNHLKDAYIRPFAWRSTDALMVRPINPKTNLMIAAWEPRGKKSDSPYNIHISKWRKPTENICPMQCKSSFNYGMLSIAVSEAKEQGFDDAILLDMFGYISECTTSNIFFIKEALYTPKTTYCLNGITRQTILEIAKDFNIKIIEKDILTEEIDSFECGFITGTASGLKLINSITHDKKTINFIESILFSRLKLAYDELTGEVLNG